MSVLVFAENWDGKFKNRMEWSQYNGSDGYLLLQDVRYKPLESKWLGRN